MSKSVHIIILNWNGYNLTRDCLLSLRKIDYRNYRVTVVDNASIDESATNLSDEFPEIDMLRSDVNLGFAAGNNLALINAREKYNPDYFLLLNNDTVVDPTFLGHLLDAFKNQSIGLACSKIYFFDEPRRLWYAGGYFNKVIGDAQHYGYEQMDHGEFDTLRKVEFITGCCFMMSRSVVNRVGLLDEIYFAYCEDLDYCLRAAEQGFECVYVPRSVIYHKVSSSFKSKTNIAFGKRSTLAYYLNVRNRFFIFRKHREQISRFGFLIHHSIFCLRYIVGFLITFQFAKVYTVLKGIRDGIQMPLMK